MKVSCWNEYSTLKTVILGSMYDLDRIPQIYEGRDQESFEKIVEETTNELKEFQLILEQLGVRVLRPTQPKKYNDVDIPSHSPLINMRDFHMAYGPLFIMTYGSYSYRRFQHLWLEDVVNDLIIDGNLVLNANEPSIEKFLNNNTSKKDTAIKDHFFETYTERLSNKNLYHVASILKHGKVAYASSTPGTPIGKTWIKSWLSQIGVEYKEIDFVGHIDGVNSILRDDTILCGPFSILKDQFKKTFHPPISDEYYKWRRYPSLWKKINNPTNWLYECQGYFQNFCAEANALSFSRDKVFLSFYDKEFYVTLKNEGIEAIYIKWKNRHFWGGGLHCITCDIEREDD